MLVNGLSRTVKRTEIHFIALKTVTELGPVDHENPPIFREMLLTDAETDGWGAEDVANNTVVDFLPLLVDPIEQPFKFLHRLLRLVQ